MSQVEKAQKFSRLPTNVKPIHYNLTIIPDIDTFTFTGTEIVDLEVCEKTSSIVLNSLEIAIQSASFISSDGEQKSSKIEINKKDEIATILFANELNVGSGQLKLAFVGEINDLMCGCYRSKYKTLEGEIRYGTCTKFEPVYCRRAFPCWDEPALKAKFDITLIVPKDRLALSNTPIVEETDYELDNTKKVVRFATSPIMSTYLVAYIVGEYDHVEKITKNNTKIRIYTPVGKSDQGKFALDVAVKCLAFYEDFFKIDYPLEKLDLIALSDFASGAMENWGLITFRESLLLCDPNNSSSSTKQSVSLVIAHELAHQWFGNLVTMEWWNSLWLNEGFAKFMEYLAVDFILPEYKVWNEFVSNILISALETDAFENSHPIEVPVNHPNEISEIFDIISYYKGSSVLRMIYHFIGSDDFQKGLNLYLNKFAYKNAVTEDLWDSLEEASNKPISSIMNLWIKQKGYPVINVSSRQDGNNRILTLSQEKFSIGTALTEQDKKLTWSTPINIITQNTSKPFKILLEEKSQEFVLENVQPNEWIKCNAEMISACRFNYSPELLDQILAAVADKSLEPVDRLNIQADLYAFVQAGKLSSDRYLKVLEFYENETENVVWSAICVALQKFCKLLEYSDFSELYQLYARKFLTKIYSKVGFSPSIDESVQNSLLRTKIIGTLIMLKDPQVLETAKSIYESHTQILPDLRGVIYSGVISCCDEKKFESFLKAYRNSDLSEEKERLAKALSSTQIESCLHKIIDFAMSDDVRKQDKPFVLIYLAMFSKPGREILWSFFKKNHKAINELFGAGSLLRSLVRYMTRFFASEQKLQEVSSFFADHPVPSSERAIQQSLEDIKMNSDWLSRDLAKLRSYLTSNVS